MVNLLSVAGTLNSQVIAILNNEDDTTPVMTNRNGVEYYVLMKIPFTPEDEKYYADSWQRYRYAIVFNKSQEVLGIVSMLGSADWGDSISYYYLDYSDDFSEDIWTAVNRFTDLGKDYYGVDSINQVYDRSKYRGLGAIDYVWHGAWSDPELIYKGQSYNYWTVEEALCDMCKEDVEVNWMNDKMLNKWLSENEEAVYGMLDEWTPDYYTVGK